MVGAAVEQVAAQLPVTGGKAVGRSYGSDSAERDRERGRLGSAFRGRFCGRCPFRLCFELFDSDAAETSDRFTLTVTPDAATAGEETAPEAAFALAPVSPNPVVGGARTVLEVREAQPVRAEFVDALGRRVLVLFDGALGAGARQTLDIGAAGLLAGTYVLRVTGADFSLTQTFSVVR
jgi:hypothetical protein